MAPKASPVAREDNYFHLPDWPQEQRGEVMGQQILGIPTTLLVGSTRGPSPPSCTSQLLGATLRAPKLSVTQTWVGAGLEPSPEVVA